MQNHSEKAKCYFKQGYNCSQSVVLAFCDELNIDEITALKISSSFGGGMGRLREVCGAVSGMFMVAGLKYGYTSPKDKCAKSEHYARIQELAQRFKDKNGYIVCRDLLGINREKDSPIPEDRSKQYYKKRPCIELVGDAASILDDYIQEHDKDDKRCN